MADKPRWLTREMIDLIHAAQVREHGGGRGVRDERLIESALARPRNRWEYEPDSDLCALTAAYGFGLAKNHGFVDGNKRVAFVAMYVFLGLNGLDIEAPEPEAVVVMTEVAAGARSEEQLANWLRERTIPLQ